MSSDLLAARFAERGFALGPCRGGSGFLKRTLGRRFAGPSDQLLARAFETPRTSADRSGVANGVVISCAVIP